MRKSSNFPGTAAKALQLMLAAILMIFTMNTYWLGPVVAEVQGSELATAPISPAFLQYRLSRQFSQIETTAETSHPTGYIPAPWQTPGVYQAGSQITAITTLPAAFDLRSLGRVTTVRNQGNSGSCWSFATYGSLESALLPAQVYNFSENNLKNTHGFDFGANDGGNTKMATAYLARWSGPVLESDDPFKDTSTTSPSGLPVAKHVQEVTFLPAGDVAAIKQAIYDGGAVSASLYWADQYFNDLNDAYYCPVSQYSNHGITFVGWDDNYPAKNFQNVPAGNGAYLVKNSWGTTWGKSGYFYLSYYDKNCLNESVAFHNAEPTDLYARNYGYDPLGATSFFGNGTETIWAANVFTAKSNESLEALAFYTPVIGSTCQLKIFTDPTSTPSSGKLVAAQSSLIATAGYHSVKLDTAVSLIAGQTFAVALCLTTPGYNYPMGIEYPLTGYSSQATAQKGQSYYSNNGTSWTDITSFQANTNVCIKAFTTSGPHELVYNGNGHTSGSVSPEATYADNTLVTVAAAGTLARSNYLFVAWNTKADGTGTSYDAGATFHLTSDLTLYAQWLQSTLTGVSAKSAGYDRINLTWFADPAADGYEILRAPAAADLYLPVKIS